jgi:hypothetical protein
LERFVPEGPIDQTKVTQTDWASPFCSVAYAIPDMISQQVKTRRTPF